jgi:hypothetical protein
MCGAVLVGAREYDVHKLRVALVDRDKRICKLEVQVKQQEFSLSLITGLIPERDREEELYQTD